MRRVSKANHNQSQRRDKLTAQSTNRSSIAPFVVVTENRDSRKNKSFVRAYHKWHSQSLFGVTIFSADGHGLCRRYRMYRLPTFQSQFKRDLVISSHQTSTIKNQRGSVRTIPFGRADKLSSQPRISSRGANQKRSEVPTHWAASLARYVSVHLHSRKMKPPWLHHAPKTERPAASHHRSDFGWES